MEKNNNETNERVDILFEISRLPKEKQKQLAKTLIGRTIGYEFIERTIEAYEAGNLSMAIPSKEKVEEQRIRLCDDVSSTLNSMLDTIFGKDDELKFRIFKEFIDKYGRIEEETRKEICGFNHDFTDWYETIGDVPQYDEDGDIDGYISNKKYLERKCKYCGEKQQAYSEYHKQRQEEETEYWANYIKSEPTYTKINKKTSN